MSPKVRPLLVVSLLGFGWSCGSFQDNSAPQVSVSTIRVAFRNEMKVAERWSIEDANNDAIIFNQELFHPGEVKKASISTGASRRFGEVRYKNSKAISWTRDSLIETDRVVSLRGSEDDS